MTADKRSTHREGNAGTLVGYTKDRCRCDECREFWNAYHRWYKAYRQGRVHSACPTCSCEKPLHPDHPDHPRASEG